MNSVFTGRFFPAEYRDGVAFSLVAEFKNLENGQLFRCDEIDLWDEVDAWSPEHGWTADHLLPDTKSEILALMQLQAFKLHAGIELDRSPCVAEEILLAQYPQEFF